MVSRSTRHGIRIYEALKFILFSVHAISGRNKLPFDNCLILGTVVSFDKLALVLFKATSHDRGCNFCLNSQCKTVWLVYHILRDESI